MRWLLFDLREIFTVSSLDLSVKWLDSQMGLLHEGQELALHSNVIVSGKKLHIPMIDFSIDPSRKNQVYDRLNQFLPKDILRSMAIYSSGRSLHGYSSKLISNKKWIEFMGRLLLVNPRDNQENIIDGRWVGHRLIAGYSSLRWSNKSSNYLAMPLRINYL